jgi:adenine C2-methylase RlmN of 23S rRNA A2503 and tRNA A37
MIENFTDLEEDLQALLGAGFERNTNFNLIPLNGTMTIENVTYTASSMKRCEEFKEELRERGHKCFIRYNMGEDIEAACGMLSDERE